MAQPAASLEILLFSGIARLQQDMATHVRTVGSAMSSIESSVASAKAALAGLGITLGAGAFAELLRGSIDAMDHLNDLSKSTNLTVETLAGLRVAAKQSGGDLDGIAASINKLSVSMGKDAERFRALGVSAKDPLEAFKQLSDIFVKLEDPQQRAAVMAAALGKSWATAAPLLAEGGKRIGEMVEAGTKASGVTSEMARQADELNDKWVLLVGTGGALTKMVGPLLPLLNLLADDMLKAAEKSHSLGESFSPLLEVMKVLIVLGTDVSFVFTTIGKDIARAIENIQLIARGDFAGSRALGAAFKKDAEESRAALDKYQASIMGIGTASKAVVAPINAATAADKAAATAAAAKAAAFLAGAEAVKKQKDALDAYVRALQAADDMDAQVAKEIAELDKKRTDAILGQEKTIEQIEFETKALRMSSDERQIAIALRAIETSGINKQDAAYASLAERTRAAIEAQQKVKAELLLQQQQLRDQASVWNEVGDAAGQFFADLVEHGKSAFDNLRKWVKQLLSDLIALFAKRWVLNMAAGGSAAGSAADAFAGGVNGSNPVTGAALDFAGGLAGSAFMGTATTWGATAGGAFLQGMEGIGVGVWAEGSAGSMGLAMSGVYEALAAIPVWGWIAMAVIAIGAWIAGSKSGGPKVGGSFFSGGSVPGTDNGRFYTPSQGDSAVRDIVNATIDTYSAVATRLGGTALNVAMGLGFDHDPNGSARSRVSSLLSVGGRSIYGVTGVEMDDKEVPQRLGLEATRMLVAALKETDLHDAIDALFDSVDVSTATLEQLNAVLAKAIEMKGLIDTLGIIDIPGLTIEALQAMQLAGESLTDTMNSLMQGVSTYEQNFLTAEEQHATSMERMRKQFQAMGLEMPTTRDGFRALVESLDLGTESGARFYRWLMSIAGGFADLVPALEEVDNSIEDVGTTVKETVRMIDASLSQNARPDSLLTAWTQMGPARTGIASYLNTLITGESSPLDPTRRLDQARSQYQELLSRANGGDVTAAGNLQGAADAYLRLAREMFGSSSAYVSIFNGVFDQLATFAEVKGINERMLDAQTQALGYQASMSADLIVIRDVLIAIRDRPSVAAADNWAER